MFLRQSSIFNIEVNAKDEFGQTSFHLASQIDHPNKIGQEPIKHAAVKLMIEKQRENNLELNAKTENGETALHYACKNVLPKIAKLLIQVNLFLKPFFQSVGIQLLVNSCHSKFLWF